MGSILGIGAALLAIVAVAQAVMLIIATSRLIKMPLWAPLLIPTSRTAVEDVLPVLDTARGELEHNGFRYMHTRRVRSIISASGIPYGFCDVYYHLEQDIHAEVYLAVRPTPGRLCDIHLWNTFVDGSAVLTINNLAHSLIPYPRNVRITDGRAADLAGQVATHLTARESITVERTGAADALNIAKGMAEQFLPRLEEEGLVYRRGQRGGDVVYSFRFLPAVKTAWRMHRGALQPRKKAPPGPAAASATPDFGAARHIAERIAFVQKLCMLRGMRAPSWFRRTVFALSAAAFLALGSWWWGLTGAVVVALVILVHEAGHWLAMKLAGFRDVQVFFVPGMGGATSGEKHEAHPMTHLMVYLAGPVPGLLLSLAVFAWAAFHPTQASATWYPMLLAGAVVSFFINALNMLPVLPLDGGRVIELLLVGRLPWLRFIFAVASGGVLLFIGMANGDSVMRAIGLVMLIGSQQHYRIAKASALLLREKQSAPGAELGFPQAARQLYDFMDRPAFQKWSFQTRMAVGTALLPRYLGRTPSWKETAGAMAVYIACALLPLVVLIGLVVASPAAMMGAIGQGLSGAYHGTGPASQPARTEASEPPADEDSLRAMQKAARKRREITLAAVQEPAQRQEALQQAIQDANENGDMEDALRLARLGYAEAGNFAAPARERAQAALTLISAIGSKNKNMAGPEIESLQRDAESVLRQRLAARNEKEDKLLLAQVLQAHTPATDQATLLATRQEIAALYASGLNQPDYRLADAQRSLARAQDRLGQADAAERTLRLAVAYFATAPDGLTDQQSLTNDLAWMLVAHHKLDEAAQLAASMATPQEGAPTEFARSQRNARMVLLTVQRLKGDWAGASQQARAMLDTDSQTSNTPDTGSWFVNLLLSRVPRPPDWRATLLLIDSERRLGHAAAADQLLASLRESRASTAPTPPAHNTCRAHVVDTLWQRELQQALLDIEQRELRCTAAAEVAGHAASLD